MWHRLRGIVTVELTSADTGGALTLLSEGNISIYDVCTVDEMTLHFRISGGAWKSVHSRLTKRGDSVRIIHRSGVFWNLLQLRKRPVLLSGMLILVLCALYFPGKILFIRVEGNENIPQRLILEKAAQCGIRFGMDSRTIRSENMKNYLLETIPELKWAGINTYGCTAEISVTERSDTEKEDKSFEICHIVASRDGVVTQCTVTRGNALCKVGQAVKKGEILISAYTDCGMSIRATNAQGEVMAKTDHTLLAIAPNAYRIRQEKTGQIRKYSVILGKKRINFSQDSGIMGATCVKMMQEYPLTLPGGFVLPVILVEETWTDYSCEDVAIPEAMLTDQLYGFAGEYLLSQMVAGQIVTKAEDLSFSEDAAVLNGKYACLEMIGRERNEEIEKIYGSK